MKSPLLEKLRRERQRRQENARDKIPTNFDLNKEFMECFGQDVFDHPSVRDTETRQLRLNLIEEEVQELREAMYRQDIVEIADALADILYVVYGAGHAFGIDLDKCYEEVHSSNMSKLDKNGKPIYRKDGKVMKGENYSPPNLLKIVLG